MNKAEQEAIERLESAVEVHFVLIIGDTADLEKTGTLIDRINDVASAIEDINA